MFKVIIIEDHPLIVEAYKNALEEVFKDKKEMLQVSEMRTIDEALEELYESSGFDHVNMVLLDIRLPPSKDGQVLSGEDLGVAIRKKFPDMKIVVVTTCNDNYRIHSILKNLDPDGFLIKNDLTPEELLVGIRTLIGKSPYYSETVLRLMKKQINEDLVLDHVDRKLLHELSSGTKMKELPEVLNLSRGGVERRKRNLKLIFDLKGEEDRELIKAARERGFL